ncbi:hypothetical protein A2U01_0054827, partial [Trifolium medium]|nr:hypothetical protein [Trifolium medium]
MLARRAYALRNAQVTVIHSDLKFSSCAPRHISMHDAHSPETTHVVVLTTAQRASTPARRASCRTPILQQKIFHSDSSQLNF